MRWWVVACCLLLVATACGSRLSKEEILAQNTVTGGQASAVGLQGSGQGGVAGSGAAGQSAVGSATTAAGPAGGARSGAGQIRGGEPGGGTRARAKAPIVIGFVGQLSGFGGPTTGPIRDAWVAWQKMVNARGGIKGHPVQLLIGDDGGNESRTVSIIRDFVESRGAIAISVFATSMSAVANYAKSKSLPIIGAGVFHAEWNQNPMLFPPYANIDGTEAGAARVTKNTAVTKVATLYCVESTSCKFYNDSFVRHAKANGLQVVYQGQISLTAPDYTAECLQMQNAGAQAVRPVADSTSQVRLAQSCARQGYRPIWVLTGAYDSMRNVPQFEGTVAALPQFPYFLRSGSPAIDEYVQALQKYAQHLLTDGSSSQAAGWISAKLFEKAAANVSDRPSRQDILKGLWAMKDETLNGLTSGGLARTFTRGRPTRETYCVFGVRMQRGEWVAPQALTPTCR